MIRIYDKEFIKNQYDKDKIIGVRIKNGEYYFLAWMENAEHYSIQQAISPEDCYIDIGFFIDNGNILEAIPNTDGYHRVYNLYETDDHGKLVNAYDNRYQNAYELFLTLIADYDDDGTDHNIFLLSRYEMGVLCDALKDGEYIFIIQN